MVRRIHIPRVDLDLAGVSEETARKVVERLPAALTRALSAANGRSAPAGNAAGIADALADQAARRIATTVRGRTGGGGR